MMTSRRVGLSDSALEALLDRSFTSRGREENPRIFGGDLIPRCHTASEVELRLVQRRSASLRWRRHSVRKSSALEAPAFLK
jgi:hypothetical protein